MGFTEAEPSSARSTRRVLFRRAAGTTAGVVAAVAGIGIARADGGEIEVSPMQVGPDGSIVKIADPADTAAATPMAPSSAAEMRWDETGPNKARLFSFGKIPGDRIQFGVDFNQPVPEDFVNPRTNLPFKDPKTGKDIHPENLGQALKLLMDEYEAPEFIAIGHDISELPTTENHGYFEIEDPNSPANSSPLFWDEWWIKPNDHPSAIVFNYYLQDTDLPVSEARQKTFYGYFGRMLGDTLYYFKGSAPDTYYGDTNPNNTTERNRLTGSLINKVRPASLITATS